MSTIEKIVSGGQTGVDRAALDAALQQGIACGGWCPKGRRAEDGSIDACYPLIETPERDYTQRTEWNVRDSDGTLILCRGTPGGGTAYTVETSIFSDKPLLLLDLNKSDLDKDTDLICHWLTEHDIHVLNIAGPRESQAAGIYQDALVLLNRLFGGD
ncbi:MAG: putative molybdenum carrier protein [Mariprofundaceae bacterium]